MWLRLGHKLQEASEGRWLENFTQLGLEGENHVQPCMSITEVGGVNKFDSANLLKQSRVVHLSGRGAPGLRQGIHSITGWWRQHGRSPDCVPPHPDGVVSVPC